MGETGEVVCGELGDPDETGESGRPVSMSEGRGGVEEARR
jgi:hypothetical protein